MKIGQNPELPLKVPTPAAPRTGTAAASSSAPPPAAAAPAATQGTPVTVSNLARTLGQAALGNSSASFDTAKVAAVRTAIENGTYKVDAEAIADRLLSNAQQVLRKAQG
ncbi:flagellar biosynthesis anti-sigma factor FlgM [uncultured Xylophilus sp.]|uniref:flagellar biosynthesis anti-sigma factor FlgM n=1 Tax=uncultured Xylophilus sp. TaxID=296832 RepID=UPI0025E00938|nr:flagellar biosynthesis anti-sigma factor FlgM [uncultured Xylophilus sp.]